MGAGTMQVKNYRTKRGYYLSYDTDEKVGGDFSLLILPLFGSDDERFFYVTELDNGKFEVEGEGYICTRNDSIKSHIQTNRKELMGKSVWYYHLDKNREIIKKEYGNET